MADNTITLTLGVDDKGTAILRSFQKTTENTFNKIKVDSESLVDSVKKHWLGLTAAATATGLAINKAWGLAEMAAKFEEQKTALNSLAGRYNTTADQIIDSVKKASNGMVSMAEAAQVSAKGLMMGLNPEQLVKFMEVVTATTDATGQSVPAAFEAIVQAAATGRDRALKQMGIMVDLNQAYKDYASNIHVSVDRLTEEEKQTAGVNAVLAQSSVIMAKLGDAGTSTADRMDQFKASIEDLKLAIGGLIVKAGVALFGVFQGTASAALFLSSGVFGIVAALGALSDKLGLTKGAFAKWRGEAEAAFNAANDLALKARDNFKLVTEGETTGTKKTQTGYTATTTIRAVDQTAIDAINKALSSDILNREKALYGEALNIVKEYEAKKIEIQAAGGKDFTELNKWLNASLKLADEKQAGEYATEQKKKLAADNKYHLDKWQSETEWAAKERELQGKTITESLADTNKAIEDEIQLQLSLIALKEKEGQISPLAAIDQRLTFGKALLSVQEDALANATAYTLEWYAAADAVAKTRGGIVALAQSKISVAIDILSSPTKAIDEGIRYLAGVLDSIPDKLKNTWEALKGLFSSSDSGGTSDTGAAQDQKTMNKALESAGLVGEIILLVKAIADFPKMLSDFIKSFMQSLYDFPDRLIELLDTALSKLPIMISDIFAKLMKMIPKILESAFKGIINLLISTVYAMFAFIPGLKLNTGGADSGLDKNTTAVNKLADSIDNLNDSINKQLTDLLTGTDSPASAIERLQIAWGEVSKAKGAFAGATGEAKVEAGSALQDALKTYLDVAQEAYQRPSTEYQAIFDTTVADLKAIQAGLAGIDTSQADTSMYSISFDSSVLLGIFSQAWEGLKQVFSDAWEFFKTLPGMMWNAVKGLGSSVWDAIKGLGSSVWNAIKGLPNAMWDAIKGLPQAIFDAVKGALGLGGGGGIDWDISHWSFHTGGIIPKAHTGLFIGPELASYERPIIAKVGEGILNDYNGMRAIGGEAGLNYANKTGRFPGGGAVDSRTITYSVSIPVTIHTKTEVNEDAIARKFKKVIEDSFKYGQLGAMAKA